MSKLKDQDNDGIPDVVEDAFEDAKAVKRLFGFKGVLIMLLIGLIVAGYGVGAFFYLDMKDKYVTLQGQYNYEKGRWELDEKYKMIEERDKLLLELDKKQKELDEIYAKAKEAREKVEEELKSKPYRRRNENEAQKLSTDGLLDRFSRFGFTGSKSER